MHLIASDNAAKDLIAIYNNLEGVNLHSIAPHRLITWWYGLTSRVETSPIHTTSNLLTASNLIQSLPHKNNGTQIINLNDN